ncbi:hypothetical protein [Streptomyces sp. NRRL S-448]|uniref:hypothetical protein n=1 Tax=Streptomyces sp. NRRL S-448 TaxID=1463907 RepID=UPI003564315C
MPAVQGNGQMAVFKKAPAVGEEEFGERLITLPSRSRSRFHDRTPGTQLTGSSTGPGTGRLRAALREPDAGQITAAGAALPAHLVRCPSRPSPPPDPH